MPPRGYTAPPTNAARIFNCDLCNKSYARQNDYDTHLSSYDHSHRARMIGLKRITADTAKPRPTKRAKRDDMSAPLLPLEPGIKKKSGGGFTKIQDLAKKAAAEAVKPDVEDSTKAEGLKAQGPVRIALPPAPPKPKKEYMRVLVSNQSETDLERRDQEQYPPPPESCPPQQTPDIPDQRTEGTKVVLPSTNDFSSDFVEPDTNLEKKVFTSSDSGEKPTTDEEIGYGLDKDYEPDYYDPTRPTPCDAIGCKCGAVPTPQEKPAGITA